MADIKDEIVVRFTDDRRALAETLQGLRMNLPLIGEQHIQIIGPKITTAENDDVIKCDREGINDPTVYNLNILLNKAAEILVILNNPYTTAALTAFTVRDPATIAQGVRV